MVFSCLPKSYACWKMIISAVETHFYQAFFVAMFTGALLYTDYCLVGIWLVNVMYLGHRHFCRFDYVVRARFDPTGHKEEAISGLWLQLDIFTIIGAVLFSSLLILHRLSYTAFWLELSAAVQTLIEL